MHTPNKGRFAVRIFISGGCKNGKSYYAQRLSKRQKDGPLYYVATMISADHEDDERIQRHRGEREGWGFITVEQPRDIADILRGCEHSGSFLLDSLTALLANEMFPPGGDINENAAQKISGELIRVIEAIPRIVIVSDYIYSDALRFDPLTELYRKSLAALDSLAAKHCDVVLEAAYTGIITHKGGDALHAIR